MNFRLFKKEFLISIISNHILKYIYWIKRIFCYRSSSINYIFFIS